MRWTSPSGGSTSNWIVWSCRPSGRPSVGEAQRQRVPALVPVKRIGAVSQRVSDPVVVLIVIVLVAQSEEEAFATRLERFVEREVVQPVQLALAHRDRPARILGMRAQNLDDGVVVPIPECADRRLVPVNDAILERGPNRRGDPLLDEGRVPHHGFVYGRPVRLGGFEQEARHRIDERVRGGLRRGGLSRGDLRRGALPLSSLPRGSLRRSDFDSESEGGKNPRSETCHRQQSAHYPLPTPAHHYGPSYRTGSGPPETRPT